MSEVLRILYREMHYQMLKRNPVMNDEKIVKGLRKLSIKSFFYTLFGCFIAGIALTNNKAVIASLAVTLHDFLHLSTVHNSRQLPLHFFSWNF